MFLEVRDILLWNLGIESATTLRLPPSPHTLLTLQDAFHDLLSDHLVLGKATSSTVHENSSNHRCTGTEDDTVRVPLIVGDEGSSDGRADETRETDHEGRLSDIGANLLKLDDAVTLCSSDDLLCWDGLPYEQKAAS